MILSVST